MIATVAKHIKQTKCVPPEPNVLKSYRTENASMIYTFNKTAWMIDNKGEVSFELRASNVLTSVAFNDVDMIAIGDTKGVVKVYRYSQDNGIDDKPFVEGQVLTSDVQVLKFCSRDVLAAGGGLANQSSRQFMSIFRVLEASKEFKMMCDGTGGPTKPVNDIATNGDIVAFASDDRSVTLFNVGEKSAIFYKAFTDYGGLVGKVIMSKDGNLIAYGSGGSNGKFLIRNIHDDSPAIENTVQCPSGDVFFDSGRLTSTEYGHLFKGSKGAIKTLKQDQEYLTCCDHVGELVFRFPFKGELGALNTENENFTAEADGRKISVIRRDNNQPVRTSGWTSHDSLITGLVFIDKNLLASVGLDGHLFIWNVDVPLRPVASLSHAHHGPISNVALNENTEVVTFGQEDAVVRFFQIGGV